MLLRGGVGGEGALTSAGCVHDGEARGGAGRGVQLTRTCSCWRGEGWEERARSLQQDVFMMVRRGEGLDGAFSSPGRAHAGEGRGGRRGALTLAGCVHDGESGRGARRGTQLTRTCTCW